MNKKIVLHSGGADSLAIMLEYVAEYKAENLVSLGFNYGQRHFEQENKAATAFCNDHGVVRTVLDIPLGQIGGCSLTDKNIAVTENMAEQRSTVVPMRNALFIITAASLAQVIGADTIVHGACVEDDAAYRDCRAEFFNALEILIQSGITNPVKGSECITDDYVSLMSNWSLPRHMLDIVIDTPLLHERKEDTMSRILKTFDLDVYKYSYTCYNGGEVQCGRCPSCVERQISFYVNGVVDPLPYTHPLNKAEMDNFLYQRNA